MTKTRIALLLLLSACSIWLAGCSSKPVLDIRDHPITWLPGVQGDWPLVEGAILLGLADRGWGGKIVRVGTIEGSILVRGKHRAKVQIHYDLNRYSIIYKNSQHLDYDPRRQTIHRNYNRWVVNLQSSIDKRLVEVQTDIRSGR